MPQIDEYLTKLVELGGSDLHITVGAPPRVRISGSLQVMDYPAFTDESISALMREMTSETRWERYLETGDVDLAHAVPGVARFRVNMFRNHWGKAAVFRQIPSRVMTIDELKLPDVLKSVAEYKEGLVLVTGPTGSGKSTTLAAMIDHINETMQKQIITVEDPIEFVHVSKGSTLIHREVGEHARSFSRSLKSAMRADPDIILIGEMRDMETMRLALACASMGMLVFATLHTNNAPKTIDRFIDAFPADEQNLVRVILADSLKAIISQLLCKRVGGGRVAVHEILLEHEALPHTIRQHNLAQIRNIIDGNRHVGMVSMDAVLTEKLKQGIITAEEAYMKASDKAAFAHLVQQA